MNRSINRIFTSRTRYNGIYCQQISSAMTQLCTVQASLYFVNTYLPKQTDVISHETQTVKNIKKSLHNQKTIALAYFIQKSRNHLNPRYHRIIIIIIVVTINRRHMETKDI